MLRQLSKAQGFTLVEIVIVVTVCGILTGLLFGPMNDLYLANTQGLTSTVQSTDVRSALRQMEKTIQLGNGFIYNVGFPDVTGKQWQWNDTEAQAGVRLVGNPLIVSSYMSETIGSDRTLAVQATPVCTYLPVVLNYYTVFYVRDATLYRRTIKPTPSTTCDGGTVEQKNSCLLPATTTNCQINDAVLLRNVTGFTIAYYTNSTDKDAVTNIAGSAQFATFKTAVITLETSIGTGSAQARARSSLRMSFVNV